MNKILSEDIEYVIQNSNLFSAFRNRTVLITGASGLIGSMMVRVLHAANIKYGLNIHVIGIVRNIEKAKAVLGELVECDDILVTVTADDDCDYIVHTVSPTASKFFIEHPVETIQISVNGTMQMLEHARKNSASMVYLSSMEEYGVPYEPGQIMTEDKIGIIDHLNIRSSYSESKRLCECMCASYAAEYGVKVCIARLAQTFGAGVPVSDNRMPVQFARAAAQGHDIVLHTQGKSVSNVVYLADAIIAILYLLNRGAAGEAYNVCNDKETRTVRQIAELVAEKTADGKIGVAVDIPPNANFGYAPDVTMHLNSDKLRNLGWQPEINMEEAYRRLTEYLRTI